MTSQIEPVTCLNVDREELQQGIAMLFKLARFRSSEEVVLRLDGGGLSFSLGGASVTVEAQGRWPVEVRVPAMVLRALGAQLPGVDPLTIKVVDRKLHIGPASVSCNWQPVGAATDGIPQGATLMDLLRIARNTSERRLEASGVMPRIQAARTEKNRLIEGAAATLQPLGVLKQDLEALVEALLERDTEDVFRKAFPFDDGDGSGG